MTTEDISPNQALWEKGDFGRIANTMRESGEKLVNKLGITEGQKILDLGCGDGTTAIPAAKLRTDVLGVDISRNLVAAGNKRAQDAQLHNCRFQHGNAINLQPLADNSFDMVISIFGAMFAPDPVAVAKEMVRVARPGGKVVMGNWIPNDPTLVAQILKICASYTPPPPEGFVSPMTWGVESEVKQRFTTAGVAEGDIELERDTFSFDFSGTPADFVDEFRLYYGPTMNAFDAAQNDGRAEDMQRELVALFTDQNRGSQSTVIDATYLRVTVNL